MRRNNLVDLIGIEPTTSSLPLGGTYVESVTCWAIYLDKTTLPVARGSNNKHISGSNQRRVRNRVPGLILQYHEESRLETRP